MRQSLLKRMAVLEEFYCIWYQSGLEATTIILLQFSILCGTLYPGKVIQYGRTEEDLLVVNSTINQHSNGTSHDEQGKLQGEW